MNAVSPEVSAFFRDIQAKGVKTKLARTTPEERRKHAIAMNNARWAKHRAHRAARGKKGRKQ